MATNENLIPIPGRLHSVATEGHVAGANEIYDDSLSKDQQTINAEVQTALGTGGTVDQKIEAAVNTLDSTASQTAASANGYLNLSVTETNGKVTAISGSIDDAVYIDDTESSPAVVPGFDPTTDTVHVTAQTLSEQQKAQVRTNIGLGDVDARINQAVASEASQRAAAVSSVQSSVNTETSRAQAKEAQLQSNIAALTQSNIVVGELPATGVENTIYRVPGTTSYTDYMWDESAFVPMATYNNAIDNEPIAGSNNLVKSGGVYSSIKDSKKMNPLLVYSTGARNVLSDLNDAADNTQYDLVITSSSVPDHLPSDFPLTGTEARLTTSVSVFNDNKILKNQTIDFYYKTSNPFIYFRQYNSQSGGWGGWSKCYYYNDEKDLKVIPNLAVGAGASAVISDLNGAADNTLYTLLLTGASNISNLPSDYPLDGSDAILDTRKLLYNGNTFKNQTIKFYYKNFYYWRQFSGGSWGGWSKVYYSSVEFHVGTGQQFTRLRDAVAEAVKFKDSTVIVHEGTYDLATEFATELSNNLSEVYGINLTNGVKLKFMAASYVKALIELNETRMTYFNPFYISGSCEIDGLNIEVANTRYCVHDDAGGKCIIKYRNCVMKNHSQIYVDQQQVGHCFYQCIGGGLRLQKFIEIDGCVFDSQRDNSTNINAVSYHNGYEAECDGKIFVRNCYFYNENGLSIQWYGVSTIMTTMYACNNSFGKAVECVAETESSTVVNVQVKEWLNEIRTH